MIDLQSACNVMRKIGQQMGCQQPGAAEFCPTTANCVILPVRKEADPCESRKSRPMLSALGSWEHEPHVRIAAALSGADASI
jgi:hypothetical protein